jgi:hypothetical protein
VRYALSPNIKQMRFVFKGLIIRYRVVTSNGVFNVIVNIS